MIGAMICLRAALPLVRFLVAFILAFAVTQAVCAYVLPIIALALQLGWVFCYSTHLQRYSSTSVVKGVANVEDE